MKPNLSFYSVPFLYIFTAYFIGTISANIYFEWNMAIALILFSILLISIELNFRKVVQNISMFVFPFLFFCAGFVGNGLYMDAHYSSTLSEDEISTVQLLIKDLTKTRKDNWKGIAQIQKLNDHELSVQEQIVFYANHEIDLAIGDIIETQTKVNAFQNKGNPGEFNSVHYWNSKGIRFYTFLEKNNTHLINRDQLSFFDKITLRLRQVCNRQLEKQLDGTYLSISKALILGDKSTLSDDTKATFSKTGAMHLLAVSGLHIGLILFLLSHLFSLFSSYISKRTALIASVVLLWIYAMITGASPSVIRAVFMFSILSLSQLTGKSFNAINTLFFTALLFMIFNPKVWLDISFQLSFSAMIGIYLLYPKLESTYVFKHKVLTFLWQGIALCLSAQAFTFPIVLYHFHTFPNYFILSNIVLIALSGILLGLGVILLFSSKIAVLSSLIAKLFSFLLFLLLFVLFWIEHLPASTADGFSIYWWMIPLLPILLFGMVWNDLFNKKWIVFFILLLPVAFIIWITRFENLHSKHVVFFNHTSAVIAVKQENHIVVLIESEQKNSFQVMNLLSNYTSIYPGRISLIEMDSTLGTVYFGPTKIEWEKTSSEISLRIDEQNYTLCYSNFKGFNDSSTVINMPWSTDSESLKYGAKIFPLD